MDNKSGQRMKELLTAYRMPLFSVAMIWIYFRHNFFYNDFSFGILDPITHIGDIGVDIFLFLSGYGLTFSIKKYPDSISFYKRRLIRILPSVIILLGIFAVVDPMIGLSKWYEIVKPQYWFFSIYSIYWYVGAILLFYMLFPFIINKVEQCGSAKTIIATYVIAIAGVLLIKFSHIGIFQQLVLYFARVPIFVMGVCMAYYGFWRREMFLACFIVSIPLVYLLPKDLQRISYSLMAVAIVCYLPYILDKLPSIIKKALKVSGLWSLEFYLIHIYLLKNNTLGIINERICSQSTTSLIVLTFVLLLSWIANNAIVKFIKTVGL